MTNPITEATLTAIPSTLVHPDYAYWAPYWRAIRAADLGEIEVKRHTTAFLPKLKGHDEAQYKAYLMRAVFYNMTAKTLNALYGTMFRRNPKVTGLPSALVKRTAKFTKCGMNLNLTAKTAAKEVIAVGRYGMLVDSAPSGRGGAYIAAYTAENILDWHMEEIDGEMKFTRIVLREVTQVRENSYSPYKPSSRYRVLALVEIDGGHLYEQYVYDGENANGVPDWDSIPDSVVTPTVRGEPLDYIPFVIIGPFTNKPDVQKSPILDIVTLNFSHYRAYAQLEQGLFFTANPVYYTATDGSGEEMDGEYYVGPDIVWELGKDGKAGIIEFEGHGLRSLESSLERKENQIAAIGGRLMPGGKSSGESDTGLQMKEQNEQTLLLNVADTMDDAFTKVMRWWADWNNVAQTVTDGIVFEVNRDFLLKNIGAREFRAIHQMYADGVLPVEVVYEYLRKAEVIPDWMGQDEFISALNDSKQFPHMVDVLARMQNFPDAKSFHEYRVAQEYMAKGLTPAGDPIIEVKDEPPAPAKRKKTEKAGA